MTTAAPPTAIELLTYQRALFADRSRVAVACWCRQAGKDFTTAAKAVRHAIETHQDWYIVSVTQRQADATFAKCRRVAGLYKHLLKSLGEARYSDRDYDEYDREIDQHFRCTARTLHLPGGGSVTALPGRDPDTLAGLTGNVIFTEFALFPRGGYDHWRVVFPLTTRGYQVVVISTPRGKNTKFYELVAAPRTYSVSVVTIVDAVAGGLKLTDNNGEPCTIEEFKAVYGDEVGWRREYLCEFSGDLEALIKWAQLEAAAGAYREVPFDCIRIRREAGWRPGLFGCLAGGDGKWRPEIGWDVARHGDLSALWVNVRSPGCAAVLRYLVLMQDVSFALQREIVISAMDANRRAVGCGDATGLGMDSNETLHTKYGDRWQPVTFTGASKRELGSLLKTAFDDNDQLLPPLGGEHGQKYIATDLYAIQADRGGENLKLVETPNPLLPESHCDIAYAAALARKAASLSPQQGYLWVA